ncbi:hypothetical protein HKX48_007486 [Thoreauomyces humboldtii]|nr:hypothetical protein HKX48_007486 [Thoreauomyces humboldtii]
MTPVQLSDPSVHAPAANGKMHVSKTAAAKTSIVDLRGTTSTSNTDANMTSAIIKALSQKSVVFPQHGKKDTLVRSIPTMVLYDDRGLEIFDKITYVPDYYLTEAEIDVLKNHADHCIAKVARDGSVLVELGCGAMRKTKYILEAIEKQQLKNVTYYAVDLSESSLRESLGPLTEAFPSIKFVGLLGCYEDSVEYIARTIPDDVLKTYLWLGSSIGNLNRTEAATFLRQICDKGMNVGDTFLCGIDRRNDPDVVGLAYNDRQGVTRDFILNGLDHVNRIFGRKVIDREGFEYVSIYNDVEGRHEAYYRSLRQQAVGGPSSTSAGESAGETSFSVVLEEGEILNVEYSYKYSKEEVDELVDSARFYNVGKYTDSRQMYDLHLFSKPPFFFEKASKDRPAVPTTQEWEQLWTAWDTVTGTMIPPAAHLARPISLRHPFIFYLGHIPAFLDIQLSRAENSAFTSPQSYTRIFERGIDPDLENPEICHTHSEVPDEWPSVHEVLDYKSRVRDRLRKVLAAHELNPDSVAKRVRRVLWMCYEHEAMHLETLLYMLVQSPTTLPPNGVLEPIPSHAEPEPVRMVRVQDASIVQTGINDPESDDFAADRNVPPAYGWDNEKPVRDLPAPAPYEIQSRMVTISEYVAYLDQVQDRWNDVDLIPASWGSLGSSTPPTPGSSPNGSTSHSTARGSARFGLKTPFGIRPLDHFRASPVSLSYNQAFKYACVQGMRLPSENELRTVRRSGIRKSGHYGFASWVPMGAASSPGETGVSVDEGLWEWTSTVFDRSDRDGYVQSEVYPGYSADFFDGKHNVVLGGSWATVPRIAERESLINWYQRGYPYVFSGFRLARTL